MTETSPHSAYLSALIGGTTASHYYPRHLVRPRGGMRGAEPNTATENSSILLNRSYGVNDDRDKIFTKPNNYELNNLHHHDILHLHSPENGHSYETEYTCNNLNKNPHPYSADYSCHTVPRWPPPTNRVHSKMNDLTRTD